MGIKIYKKHVLLFLLTLGFILAVCGTTSAAVTTDQNTTYQVSDNSSIFQNDTSSNLSVSQSSSSNSKKDKKNKSDNVSNEVVGPDPVIIRTGVTYTSIQAAINDAQSGDTIRLENNAVFYEHITVNKSLTFDVWNADGTGPGGYATIDGSNSGIIANITANSLTVTFKNITFTHGGSVTGNGGAIYNNYSGNTIIVNNCTFTSNTVNGNGGAIYNTGRLTINGSNFTTNSATNGGAIWSSSSLSGTTLNITESNLINNTATSNGGAIYNDDGNAEIHFNRIIGNSPNNSQIRRAKNGGTVNIVNNWWGTNSGSTGKTSGTVTSTTYLVLTATPSPAIIPTDGTSVIIADLMHDQKGTYYNPAIYGNVPDGIPVTFALSPSSIGTLNTTSSTITNGSASTTFTGNYNTGTATVGSTLDSQTQNTTITVTRRIYVSTTGSDTTGDGSEAKPYKTINKGITMVASGGTVHIADGTYQGTGNVNLTISKNVNLTGGSSTIVDGANTNRIFIISNGYNVTLSNLTLTNGRVSNSNGGAIQNNGGTLTINNCFFTNNSARRTGTYDETSVYGGAIYNTNILNIINSTFTSNSVVSGPSNNAFGGAIYNTGTLNITGSIFTSNSSNSTSGTLNDDGGAIDNYQGNLTITNTTFTQNSASEDGGAIIIGDEYTSGMNVNITGSTFTNNTAGYGGAIWNNGGSSSINPATITETTFTGNSATYGGAVRNWGYLTITKTTFTNNSGTYGGALNNNQNYDLLTVTESTFTGNSASDNGATLYNTYGNAELHFNTIIGNTSATEIYLYTGTINAQNNWWGSNSSPSGKVSNYVNVNTWLVLSHMNASPNLIHVGETSTVTVDLTHDNTGADHDPASGHVPDGIPVNFAGNLGTIPSTSTLNGRATSTFTAGNKPGIATVQATVHSQSVSTQITIGRDAVYVSPTGNDTTGDGSATNPLRTITAGVAAVYPGGTLHIANGTYNEHDITINKNMTITGESAASTIINAQQLGGIFTINSGTSVSISNITLENGSSTTNGGAINNAGNLTLTGNNLLNNTATGTGGTLYNTGTATLTFNRIIGTGNVIDSPSRSVNAINNWWDSNDSPSGKISGSVDVSKWLVLGISASPDLIHTTTGTSTVTADLTHNNAGEDTSSLGYVPDGTPIIFTSTLGTVNPGVTSTVNGKATTTFTAGSKPGEAIVEATDEDVPVTTQITLNSDAVYVKPTGDDVNGDGTAANPFKTIAKGLESVYPGGQLYILNGTYQGESNRNLTISKNMTIIGESAVSTVIDAEGQSNIFNINSGTNVTLYHLTLENGSSTNGGAINNAGTLTVLENNLLNNTATNGGALYNTGSATVNFNRIIGTGNVVASPSGSVDALNNWCGTNDNPSDKVTGNVNTATWLVLSVNASPTLIGPNGTSIVTADLNHSQNGTYYDPAVYGYVPNGIPVNFNSILGSTNPSSIILTNGNTTTIFTAGSSTGVAYVSATVDEQKTGKAINIESADVALYKYIYTNRYTQYDDASIVYNIVVKNLPTSPNDATNIIVTNLIPTGLQFISASVRGTDSGTYNEATDTWTIPRVAIGGYAYLDITLKVVGTGTRPNTGYATADQNDPDLTNNNAENTPNALPLTAPNCTDIAITQTINNPTPTPGETITITITVKNNGPLNTDNLETTCKLDQNIFENITSNGTYNPDTGIWTIGTLNNLEKTTLTITANIKNTTPTGTTTTITTKRTGTTQYLDHLPCNNSQTNNLTTT